MKIEKISSSVLIPEGTITNIQNESTTDTYSCDFINSLLQDSIEIDLSATDATCVNAWTLETGVYTIKPSTDSTDIKTVYFPLASGATLSASPRRNNGCFHYGANIVQIPSLLGEGKIYVDVVYYDEDWNVLPNSTGASWRSSNITITGGKFTTVIAKNLITTVIVKEYKNIDSILFTNNNNEDTYDYYEQIDSVAATLDDATSAAYDRVYVANEFTTFKNLLKGEITICNFEHEYSVNLDDEAATITLPKGTIITRGGGTAGEIITSASLYCPMIYSPDGTVYRILAATVVSFNKLETVIQGGGGVGNSTIYVTDEEPAAANDGDLWIDSDGIDALESEVVNSLEGNETTKAPSVSAVKTDLINIIYPIGSIYMSVDSANPYSKFGVGTWVAWGNGRVPVGIDTSQTEFSEVEKTGGEKTHKLVENEIPRHRHSGIYWYDREMSYDTGSSSIRLTDAGWASGNANTATNWTTGYIGGDQAHNNLQPYITCYMWKRTE